MMPGSADWFRIKRILVLVFSVFLLMSGQNAWASIDVDFLRKPWPKEHKKNVEIGRTPAQWRQYASKKEGIFAGMRFKTPFAQKLVWQQANDFSDVGKKTPGVTAVRFTENTPTRQVIQVDIKVLWKKLTLTFEIEEESEQVMKFRMANKALGEYRGVSVFTPLTSPEGIPLTEIELSTWLKTSRPVPNRLLLAIERMAMLQGAEEFLKDLERCNSERVTAGLVSGRPKEGPRDRPAGRPSSP